MASDLRIVYLGMDGTFGGMPLKAAAAEFQVVKVFTGRPARLSGLGRLRLAVSLGVGSSLKHLVGMDDYNLATICRGEGIPHGILHDINAPGTIREIRDLHPDLICIASFPQILREEILSIPRLGCVNLHSSLLPWYPGAVPYFWMARNGEIDKGGITLHWAVRKADAGGILAVAPQRLWLGMGENEYFKGLAPRGAELLSTFLRSCAEGRVPEAMPNLSLDQPQSRRPKPNDLVLDPSWTRRHAYWFFQVAARHGRPWFSQNGQVLEVREAHLHPRGGLTPLAFADGPLWVRSRPALGGHA